MGKNNECFRIFEPVIFESKELLQVHEMLDKLLLETWRNAHIESFFLILVFGILLTTANKLIFFFKMCFGDNVSSAPALPLFLRIFQF